MRSSRLTPLRRGCSCLNHVTDHRSDDVRTIEWNPVAAARGHHVPTAARARRQIRVMCQLRRLGTLFSRYHCQGKRAEVLIVADLGSARGDRGDLTAQRFEELAVRPAADRDVEHIGRQLARWYEHPLV